MPSQSRSSPHVARRLVNSAAPRPAARPEPLPDSPTRRCAPPAILLDLATPQPLGEAPTVRCAMPAAPQPPPFLDEASTVRAFFSFAEDGGEPSPLTDGSTVRSFFCFDEPVAAEILDLVDVVSGEIVTRHQLPRPESTCFAIPIFTDDDLSDDDDDFEPVPTLLDNLPTLAAPLSPEAAPRWTINRTPDDGLELVLALPAAIGAPPDGLFPLSFAHRRHLITALEARVGVSLDSPVRRDLLDEDLHLPLCAGAVRICLDRTDGETLFGAPLYHAWLAHERELADLHHERTRPGIHQHLRRGYLT